MRKIDIIPSKSDAHRALICAALSTKPCQVICQAESKDIAATRKCLEAVKDGREEMYCGESGSTLRFLLPVMGALGHKASFYPEGRLPERPLSPLYEELIAHGCRLSPQGSVPFTIEGQLTSGTYHIPGDVSSQYISGLLFALPVLAGDSRIVVKGVLQSKSYVDMTVKVLMDFGIEIIETAEGYLVPGGQAYQGPENYQVEGDWSNGCFWLAAGALLPEGIRVKGLNPHSLQGDKQILEILAQFGAVVNIEEEGITVKKGELNGIRIDARQIPDMVPALAVVAAAATGKTEIVNAERLRIKESDRLKTVAENLKALGADIEELAAGLVIRGSGALSGGQADSYNDHRIAMMAGIASILCTETVTLKGADAVNKSYPGFWAELEALELADKIERV